MRTKTFRAFAIAMFIAASLHVSVTPASAHDSKSFCAMLEAVRINIESSMAPSFAKDLAISAIYGSKRAAMCIE